MDTEVLDEPEAPVGVRLEPVEPESGEPAPARDDEDIAPALLDQLERLDLESSNGEAWQDLEDLYAALPETGFEVDESTTANLPLMETHARGRNYLSDLIRQREAHARRMLEEARARIERYRLRAIEPVERALARHEECLGRLLALSGQRRIDLVHGRVEYTARREDLQKEEQDQYDGQIVAWLKEQGHEQAVRRRVEESPDMRAVKKLWKQQGVVPPHTRVVTVGGNLKITPPEAWAIPGDEAETGGRNLEAGGRGPEACAAG